MFVITVSKKRMVKTAAVAVCVMVACAVAIGIKGAFSSENTAVFASKNTKLSTTQEMIDYIAQKGYTADLQTAQVTEVEIPKKFDATFENFNEKIKQTDGLSLEKYKGQKVNKWTFGILDSNQDADNVAVLLIKKEKLVGAYILQQPDGTAKPMTAIAAEKGTL